MAPRVSVLLPVCNAETWLGVAMDSILAQSFTDFELLVHDDGSTDGSLAILQDYAARDRRVVLTSEPNKGLIATLNQLIDAAQGDLIARMDADDIALPERFAKQVAWLDQNPDYVLLGGAIIFIDEAGRHIAPEFPPRDHETLDDYSLRGTGAICHPAVMMRTETVRQVGGYDMRRDTAEDLDLWLRMAEAGRLASLPDIVLKYRLHDQSISGKNNDRQRECIREICADACARRGVTASFDYQDWRMTEDRASRRDFYLKYGWDAWNWGYRDTWRHYALKAVTTDPLSLNAWKLLVFGAIRRPPPGKYVLEEQ
ncbi:glycosyltransferase [uncultured Roseobacter sp.]|uniref:glycosyltransferase family 2 protein n=1 Tax=uncultured Roseobacter sp. TaxID=114847 RepID=UPI00261EC775|nr:glycosyltransferase [uncultured Roseobacter sp.]